MHREPRIDPLGRGQIAFRDADRRISQLAAAQHGRVARWQLVADGVSTRAIEGRIERGILIPVHRGVYALGHRGQGNLGVWSAAVLLGGPGALLSHRAASALRALLPSPSGYTEITTPTARQGNRTVRTHQATVVPDERETIEGIPVTTLHRTLIDLAAVVTEDQLDRAVERAFRSGVTDPVPLDVMLVRHRGRRGVKRLRRVLARGRSGGHRIDELEERFWRFLGREGIPLPETNVRLEIPGEFIVPDCVWRDRRLVAELDSREHHFDPVAFEVDRERDAALVAAGWRAIRITWRRLHADPGGLAAQLRAALGLRAPATSASGSPRARRGVRRASPAARRG